MPYVRKKEHYEKLMEQFKEKCRDRWSEYTVFGEYTGRDNKLLFRHSCGHEFMMTPHNFSNGHGCPVCARKILAKKISKTKGNKVLSIIENSNGEYVLLSEYVNSKTPVRMKHTVCGREFERVLCTSGMSKQGGGLCPFCNQMRIASKLSHSLESANERLAKSNPEFSFVTYAGSKNMATIRHEICGNTFIQKAAYFIVGDGHCPICTTNISKEEREIFNWVKSFCPDVIQSDRTILNGKELDMYIPSKKVAIEFNGHYWHSKQKLQERMTPAQAKKYHRNKSDECAKLGIRLIHIWDYEWEDPRKQRVLKNIILGATQSLPERYYARNCKVMRYDDKSSKWGELNAFFAQNNIQGNRGGKFVYTLELNGEILMAYKFGRPAGGLAKKKYQYEMVRGASKYGVQVIGGATKLWKNFIRNEQPESVVYYIDYNYFDGSSVEKIGLKYVGGQPGVRNYFLETGEVKGRQPSKNSEIKKLIDEGLVIEMWNAGVKTYEYHSQPVL